MPKLNQIIAVVQGKKTEAQKACTNVYRKCGTSELFNGLSRVYTPKNDGDEGLPPEGKKVQYTTKEAIKEFREASGPLLDAIATQEYGNTQATADIVVGDEVLLPGVPVTYLLFIEKQLNDVHTFVSSLPVLDISESWSYDSNKDLHVSEVSKTNRTQKVLNHKILVPATAEHPAQVEKWMEDVSVGTWSSTKFSGAIPSREKKEILERVKALQDAVKFAREQANSIDVKQQQVADKLLDFVFTS